MSVTFPVKNNQMTDMATAHLLEKLDHIAKIAASSKWKRLLYTPARYLSAIFFREIIYKLTGKGKIADATVFWDDHIKICLPASMDLYLLGCKTHDSEIRLARFIIKNLVAGDHFLDIGAYVGYYSLLASHCTGENGKVLSIEPSTASFTLLKTNISKRNNIVAVNMALSDIEEMTGFSEFPVIYSEYNTIDTRQFEDQAWFRHAAVRKTIIQAMPGDTLIQKYKLDPAIIKIDVEGAENRVITGLHNFLLQKRPGVVMEFVESKRDNANHILADQRLKEMGYSAFCILANGELDAIPGETADYVDRIPLESDNIVYKKPISSNL